MRFCLAAASAGVYLILYITREYFSILSVYPACVENPLCMDRVVFFLPDAVANLRSGSLR